MVKKDKGFVVKKERRVSFTIPITFILKIILVLFVIFCIWFILEYDHLELYWNKEKRYVSLLFTVLVSCTILLFMTPFGIIDMSERWYLKFPAFFGVLYLVIQGFEYIGVGIIFRTTFHLLVNPIYESNSKRGIMFFFDNLYVFGIAWIIYLPFISKE